MKILSSLLLATVVTLVPLHAYSERRDRAPENNNDSEQLSYEQDVTEHSVLHTILFYVPNRALDILDIFRLKIRVGPGIAAGARVTKAAQVFAGTYATAYVGLPGPRLSPLPRLPIGLESYNGAAVSVVEATVDGGIGPDYSDSEIGLGFQAAIIGFDFGFDPVEVVDLVAGVFTFDIREDDF